MRAQKQREEWLLPKLVLVSNRVKLKVCRMEIVNRMSPQI